MSHHSFTSFMCVLSVFVCALIAPGCGENDGEPSNTLVIYCAHDQILAEGAIELFEEKTGIDVQVRYDQEANKSLGLTERLIAEKDNPRADVFWNNQLLGTADLIDRGILQPYKGENWDRIPEKFKDADGHYIGFAARLRVAIIHDDTPTANGAVDDAAYDALMNPVHHPLAEVPADVDFSSAARAMPIYGTTLSHYAVLWDLMGAEGLKQWHTGTLDRGLIQEGGNGTVMRLVAAGTCRFGMTDTDDYYVAEDDGKPVWREVIGIGSESRPIVIPNTVAIITGAKHPDNAKKFVDFMTSEELELFLGQSRSRQIPLGPVDASQLPDEVVSYRQSIETAIDLRGLIQARRDVLEWLKSQ